MTKKARKRNANMMGAYPTDREYQVLRKAIGITGESESRYLIEGGLLRAQVVQDRRTKERETANALAEKFPNIKGGSHGQSRKSDSAR